MNIFATSPDPRESARALDDVRLRKMFLESCQILSTVMLDRDGVQGPYKPTHRHAPVTLWAYIPENTWWLMMHASGLEIEIFRRFGKHYKTSDAFDQIWGIFPGCDAPLMFQNSARNLKYGLDFTHYEDVHQAYRDYLNARWKLDVRPPVWTNTQPPEWKE